MATVDSAIDVGVRDATAPGNRGGALAKSRWNVGAAAVSRRIKTPTVAHPGAQHWAAPRDLPTTAATDRVSGPLIPLTPGCDVASDQRHAPGVSGIPDLTCLELYPTWSATIGSS